MPLIAQKPIAGQSIQALDNAADGTAGTAGTAGKLVRLFGELSEKQKAHLVRLFTPQGGRFHVAVTTPPA